MRRNETIKQYSGKGTVMKTVKKIIRYQRIILKALYKAGDYIKIDDLAIDCLAGPAARNASFIHAWEDLVANGTLQTCGNSLRLTNS